MSNSAVALQLGEYRDLAHAAKRLALFKSKIRAPSQGQHSSRLRGRGMTFEEVRAYQAGDDVRHIDWRVTARTNVPHTKLYSEERERAVIICLDFRANMHFATRGAFKSVVAARIGTVIGAIASNNGDRIGAISIGSNAVMRLSRGQGAPLQLFKYFCQHHALARENPDNNPSSFKSALAKLYNLAKPGSMVFILSDFAKLDSHERRLLVDLTRHTELAMIHIYDPLEAQLPADGIFRFKDAKRQIVLDTHNRARAAAYQANFRQHQSQLLEFAKRHRIHFASSSTCNEPLLQVQSQLDISQV